MRKFALATAAIAALAFSVPAFTAPALAQGVTVRVRCRRPRPSQWLASRSSLEEGRDPPRPWPARRLASLPPPPLNATRA